MLTENTNLKFTKSTEINMNFSKVIIILILMNSLIACGGGGGGTESDPAASALTQSPPVEPVQQQTNQLIKIEAEEYTEQSGIELEGPGIGYFDNDDWLKYEAVDFGDGGHNSIMFNLAVGDSYAGGKIIVRVGSLSGTVIAEHTVKPTEGWTNYASQITAIDESITGINDIYIQGSVSSGGIANIDYFIFDEIELELFYTDEIDLVLYV